MGNFASLTAISIVSLAAAAGFRGVELVRDVGDVRGGVFFPAVPELGAFSFNIVTGALSLALVALIQGAGVSQSVPNPDAAQGNLSRDFIAQGAGNIASGLFAACRSADR